MKREYSDIGGIQQQAADIIRQAYDKGYKQGIKDGNINDGTFAEKVNEAYSKGLDEAWYVAKKIVLENDDSLSIDELRDIFKDSNPHRILETFSPSNAIARVKAYEEKQKCDNCPKSINPDYTTCKECEGKQKQTDDEIKVGDEINNKWGTNGVVVEIAPQHNGAIVYSVLWYNAERRCLEKDDWDGYNVWKKTGRHFDVIEKTLEELKKRIVGEMTTQMVQQEEGQMVMQVSQQVGFAVDKDELLKALQYDRDQYKKGYEDGLKASKWISVEDRLPDTPLDVLVTVDCGDVNVTTLDCFSLIEEDGFEGYGKDVVAWQPMPVPYKGKKRDRLTNDKKNERKILPELRGKNGDRRG